MFSEKEFVNLNDWFSNFKTSVELCAGKLKHLGPLSGCCKSLSGYQNELSAEIWLELVRIY